MQAAFLTDDALGGVLGVDSGDSDFKTAGISSAIGTP